MHVAVFYQRLAHEENLMERIEPGTNNDMPAGLVLLADKGYGNIPPSPYTISPDANQAHE